MRSLSLSKPRMQTRKRARMAGVASQPDGEFARSCRQGGAVVQAARSAAALYGCSMRSGSRGIAGERSAPRPTHLHPHAHALSSPCPSCARIVCSQAATMMARSCSRAAHYALRAAASPHSTRCTPARTAHARAAAGAAPDAALCSHLACSLDAVGPHDALRACCSAPACPACELIEQAHQPHCWGGPGPNFGGKQCL